MEGTSYIINIVGRVLRHWAVSADKESIRNILCSAPSYPSIKALHDTFAYFGLKSNVYQAEFEHIKDKPHCVIHSRKDDGRFYYVKEINEDRVHLYDGANIIVKKEAFLSLWDGIVLLIEEKAVVHTATHSFNKLRLFVFLLAVLFFIGIPMLSSSPNAVIQLVLDASGLTLSYLMYGQSLFSYQDIPFCHIGKHFNCSVVSRFNPFKRILPFELPVIGMTFFIFDWLLLFGGSFQNIYILCIYGLAAGCMLSLVAYQLLKIRKYCLYCLCISFVILMKPFFLSISNDSGGMILLQIFATAIVSVIITTLVDGYGKKTKAERDGTLRLLTIKRIPFLFNILLDKSPQMNLVKDHALVFGNEKAEFTFDTIVSLTCPHCRRVVKEICTLIERWPTSFCWRVYIDGLYDKSKDEMGNSKQLYVMNQYLKDRRQTFRILKEWNFKDNSDTVSPNAKDLYEDLLADIRRMGIEHYPTILFNKHLFPTEYQIPDMEILMNDWAQSGFT